MNIVAAEQGNLHMRLTQLGAEVKSIHGLLCFVRFHINETEIFYVYNINAKDQYYLQKVLPYPVGAGVFDKINDIVEYIEKDILQYTNASKSKVFQTFVETNLELHHILHKMEDTFMNYNVPSCRMDDIKEKLKEMNCILDEIQESSKKIV
jgi:hypothetical protein